MRHVERVHGQLHARGEDDVGGMGIDVDVELRRRRRVAALEEAAAHEHDLADSLGHVRRLDDRRREIGERPQGAERSEEHTSELQSLMRISYAVFCLKKKKNNATLHNI